MKKSNIKRFFKGEIYIIITAVLWGFISVFTLPLNDAGFSSAEITFVRSVLAAVFLGAVLLFKDKKLFKVSVRDIPMLMFLGIACFMTVCLLYTISIEENGSSVAVMLMYTSPIWTVVMSRFIFKEKITPYKVVALIGILCGCALLSFGGTVNITVKGLLIGLATGLFLALYVVFGKKAGKNYSAETVTFYVFLFSGVAAFFVCRGWYIPAKIDRKSVV